MRKSRTHKGFTLIELIVVVAILGVLVGIAAPALMKYFDSGDTVKCRKQLEELAKLGAKYSQDMAHRNLLPTSGMDDDEDTPEMDESEGWWVALAPELDSTVLPGGKRKKMRVSAIFHCPGDKRNSGGDGVMIEADVRTVSYVSWTDASENPKNPNSQVRLLGKKHLDNLPWLSDGEPKKGQSVNDFASFKKMVMPAKDRHGNTIMVAYASGQVRAFEVGEDAGKAAKELFDKINPDKIIPVNNKRK